MREPHAEQWIDDEPGARPQSARRAAIESHVDEHDESTSSDGTTLIERAGRVVARIVAHLSASISATMAAKPNTTRFCIAALFMIVVAFAFKQPIHAQQDIATPTPGTNGYAPGGETTINPGVEGQIDTAYALVSRFDVLSNSLAVAQTIFVALAAMSLAYTLVAYYIRNQSIRGLGQRFLNMLLSLGIPFLIITTAPTILPTLTYAGLQIAANITGDPTSLASYTGDPSPSSIEATITNIYNNTFGDGRMGTAATKTVNITPKAIIDEGVELAWPLLQQAQKNTMANEGTSTGDKGAGNNEAYMQTRQMEMSFILALAIAIIGTFVFIAVELVIAFMQIYLVIPVAAFTLGFLGAPATASFGNGYWRVVLQALLKFTIIVFVIGFAISMAEQYQVQVHAASALQQPDPTSPNGTNQTDEGILKLAISTAVLSVSLLYVVRALPSLFGAVFSGADVGANGVQNEFEGAAMGGRGGMGGGGVQFSRTLGNRGPQTQSTGKQPIPQGSNNLGKRR